MTKILPIYLTLLTGCAVFIDTDSVRPIDAAPEWSLQPRWLRTIGGPAVDEARACAIDATGRVYVVGTVQDGAVAEDLGDVENFGGNDAFMAVYRSDGTGLAVDSYGSSGGDGFRDISIVGDNIYLAGYFSNQVDFGGVNLMTSAGADAVVISQTIAGDVNWAIPGFGLGVGVGLGVDARDGRVYATGYFGRNMDGSLDDIGFSGCGSRTAADSSSGWIAAFDDFAFGDCLWLEVIESTGSNQGSRVRVSPDARGFILVGGRTDGLPIENPANHDLWFSQLSSFGASLWSMNPRNPDGFEEAVDVVGTSSSSCAVGRFSSPIEFDDDGNAIDPGPGRDGFITCRSLDSGAHEWTSTFGSTIESRLDGAALTGQLIVSAGSFEGRMDIEAPELTASGVRDGLIIAVDSATGDLVNATSFGGTGTVLTRDLSIRDGTVCVTGTFDKRLTVGDTQADSVGDSVDSFLAVYDLVHEQ